METQEKTVMVSFTKTEIYDIETAIYWMKEYKKGYSFEPMTEYKISQAMKEINIK